MSSLKTSHGEIHEAMTFTTQDKKPLSTNQNLTANDQKEEILSKLKKLPGEHKIAVGLSGGVDSSLTAALLVEAGWEVEGLTLWLMNGKGSCCTDGIVDAAGICQQLDIPHHVVDARETFKREIVDNLLNGYEQGLTPSPCSRCNRLYLYLYR